MREKVLVLNQDYQAIGVCSAQRAFVLVLLNKAEMLHTYEHLKLRSVNKNFRYPSVIRLFRYIRLPYRQVSLSRNNIFRRDNYSCCYCGATSNLTLDHVVPRSMGGRDTWTNLVTACQDCNAKKGNHLLEETDLELRQQPFRPSFILYLRDYSGKVNKSWLPYLMLA